jgi:hypothetical protein
VNEHQDITDVQLYKERIISFMAFLKQAIPYMEVGNKYKYHISHFIYCRDTRRS